MGFPLGILRGDSCIMYMYTKLKEALMGKNKNAQSNWSPNSVRAIFVTRDAIVVAYHTRQPECVILDMEESCSDIEKNGSQGALHNLLSQRQLSCLEEIYIDGVFKNYKGIFNLESYVNSLVSTVSRLRVYGYIDSLNTQEVVDKYYKAKLNGVGDYLYALDKQRTSAIECQMVDNSDWYKKYNLREDKYSLDAKGGSLYTWFKKVEKEVEEKKTRELAEMESEGVSSALSALFNQELSYIEDITAFLELKKVLSKKKERLDPASKRVYECINSSNAKTAMKISVVALQAALNSKKLKSNPKAQVVLRTLQLFGVLSKEETSLKLEDLVEQVKSLEGFLNYPSYLRGICLKLAKSIKSPSDKLNLMMLVTLSNMGEDVGKQSFESIIESKKGSAGSMSWYTELLLGLCGYNKNSIRKVLKKEANTANG